MTLRERFLNVMEYKPVDRVPNWELGIWGHTRERWLSEGAKAEQIDGDWFSGIDALGFDRREFVHVYMGMLPGFEGKVIEKTDRYEIIQHGNGIITKALIDNTVGGTRASMDQYLKFPIENIQDLRDMKKRYDPSDSRRYPQNWHDNIPRWRERDHTLILGVNCCTGFYGVARAWMGTENLSLAFYDQPELCEEMFEFIADFIIEVTTPILKETDFDYFNFFEDMACVSGPLMSPASFRKFIFPHYRRTIDHLKGNGIKYISLDSDGNTEPLIPLFLEMGIDIHWPFERASNMDPIRIKAQYGKQLRIWGGVDKRELTKGYREIDAELERLIPLIDSGGFIPTVDHTFPPDISWDNFCYYMEKKRALLKNR